MTAPNKKMEKSRSWSSAHDWKSCNRQKRFESSNLSFSAKNNRTRTLFSSGYFSRKTPRFRTLFKLLAI